MRSKSLLAYLYIFVTASIFERVSSCTLDVVQNIINEKFEGVPYFDTPFSSYDIDASNITYPLSDCIGLDYDKSDDEVYMQIISKFFEECKEKTNEPHCQGIKATYDSFTALKEMGCTPKFKNYLPAWNSPNETSVACETGSINIEKKSFVEGKENGCNGFGLCSIVQGTLKLMANQGQTGTCGETAAFMAISRADPRRALNLATHLTWTGQLEFLDTPPCEYIYDMMPGLQELPKVGATQEEVCGKSPTKDCKDFYYYMNKAITEDIPYFPQNPGLEFMTTQAFGTSYFQNQTGGCTPQGYQIIKSDRSNYDAVENFQSTPIYGGMYYCNTLTNDTKGCKLLINLNFKTDEYSKMSDSAWEYFMSTESNYWSNEDYNKLYAFWDNHSNNFFSNKAIEEFDLLPGTAKQYLNELSCSINPAQDINENDMTSLLRVFLNEFQNNQYISAQPQITEEKLHEACEVANRGEYVTLVINAAILTNATKPVKDKNGKYPSCDHFTMLLGCDIPKNEYSIWTWAMDKTVTKDLLVAETDGLGGSLCAIITEEEKTKNHTLPKPTACTGETLPWQGSYSSSSSITIITTFKLLLSSLVLLSLV